MSEPISGGRDTQKKSLEDALKMNTGGNKVEDCFWRNPPHPGEKWRHFKGTLYEIICIAGNTEKNELNVVYQSVEPPRVPWVRPLRMFMSKVDRKKYPNSIQEWRFMKVADADE